MKLRGSKLIGAVTSGLFVLAVALIVPAVAQTTTSPTVGGSDCVTETSSPTTSRPTTTPTTPTSSGIIPPLTSSPSTTATTPTTSSSSPTPMPCPTPTTGATNNTTSLEGEGAGIPHVALPLVVAGLVTSFLMMRRRED